MNSTGFITMHFSAVDLFAGPGGLSEGFARAGFDIVCSVECDPWAVRTLQTRHAYRNLNASDRVGDYWRYVRGEIRFDDLLALYPEIGQRLTDSVVGEAISGDTRGAILQRIEKALERAGHTRAHVLLGGPPCQLYSLIGRARYAPMREKYLSDPRMRLFEHYVFFLRELQPDFLVFENVHGIVSSTLDDRRVAEMVVSEFEDSGYVLPDGSCATTGSLRRYLLNSMYFGVPQSRVRLVLVGMRKELYESSSPLLRQVYDTFVLPNSLWSAEQRPGVLTVSDAIGDLPSLRPGEGSDRWFGEYPEGTRVSEYARLMRSESEGVTNHRARTHMQSDLERYRYFIEKANQGIRADLRMLESERPDLLPEHRNRHSFVDRFKVQMWNRPSSTITAHLAKDGHYYIHPDINQLRSFTVREAARCQSFPDNYLFEGPRTEQFRQVGNAVPPLMAEKIGLQIRVALEQWYGRFRKKVPR